MTTILAVIAIAMAFILIKPLAVATADAAIARARRCATNTS